MHLLVIEDERALCETIVRSLTLRQFTQQDEIGRASCRERV